MNRKYTRLLCSFVHRDIKPANFVMGTAKSAHLVNVIDFGLAKKFCDSMYWPWGLPVCCYQYRSRCWCMFFLFVDPEAFLVLIYDVSRVITSGTLNARQRVTVSLSQPSQPVHTTHPTNTPHLPWHPSFTHTHSSSSNAKTDSGRGLFIIYIILDFLSNIIYFESVNI